MVSPSRPSQGCETWPFSSSWGITVFAMSIGIAKPTPTLPFTSELRRELRVDADHGARAIDQRTARVAVVDRGVGLQRVPDREVVRRRDLAVDGRDDAGGEGAVEAERVADRDDRVADLDGRRVAERQRVQGGGGQVDLEHGEVRRGVRADHLRLDVVAVRERDAHAALILDDVLVREDVAGGVEHDPRSLRDAVLGRRDDRDDAARVGLVDRLERELGALRLRGRARRGRRRRSCRRQEGRSSCPWTRR